MNLKLMINNHQKNIATFIHLSTFSRFVIPLGNFIAPLILWVVNKDKSEFINAHGKQAINFQMSVLLYALILGSITAPLFIFQFLGSINILDFNGFNSFSINFVKPSPLLYTTGFIGAIAIIAFIIELVLIVKASLKARDGEFYNYPLTINFLK